MDIKAEILKLQKSKMLRNTIEVNDFETAIENIVLLKDLKLIKDLCKVFDDNTENHEVMFGLVHAIESFEGEDSLIEMTNAIPYMIPQAREWAKILNYRILNHEPSKNLYVKALKKVDNSVRNIIVKILNDIKVEDPARFERSVNEILSAI